MYKVSIALTALLFCSCSSFNYKTYEENPNVEDPEPNYNITLNPDFQDFTTFMFPGNRIENFSTYFNTYYNAKENFDNAYEDYVIRILSTYSERLDSLFITQKLTQEATDNFNKSIEKSSKVIQFHKSSQFLDDAVLLIGKCYYYQGDNLKAERKFSEFISKLSTSNLVEEALLFLSRTQLRMGNTKIALERLENLSRNSMNPVVKAGAFQALAEYYLDRKDYESAVINFRKSIDNSDDNEFKAQMQYVIASVTARNNYSKAAIEFDKVHDYGTSFDLEYLARYNHLKYLIFSKNHSSAAPLIDKMIVKYKDLNEYLSQFEFLKALNYEVKGDKKLALSQYFYVIKTYPKTQASGDASFQIAKYYETEKDDYLNAYRYYKFSSEEYNGGVNSKIIQAKLKTYKKYFELRSVITGSAINTDYDNLFKKNTQKELLKETDPGKDPLKGDGGENPPKPGGFSMLQDSTEELNKLLDSLMKLNTESGENPLIELGLKKDSQLTKTDSLKTPEKKIDSTQLKAENITKAKYELAEVFQYELYRIDSAEYYFLQSLNDTYDNNYDYKSKVLFALSNLYRNNGHNEKADEVLRKIVDEFPKSITANESRRILNLPLVENDATDISDSLYNLGEFYLESKDYNSALRIFATVFSQYPETKHASRSRYAAGWIYENILILPDRALIIYRELVELDPKSEFSKKVEPKLSTYKKYLELDSVTIGSTTITDFNDSLKKDTLEETKEKELRKDTIDGDAGEHRPKPGGYSMQDSTEDRINRILDSLERLNDEPGLIQQKKTEIKKDSQVTKIDTIKTPDQNIDSTRLKAEKNAKAKYELAELFQYELNRIDSAEYYFMQAFDETYEYDYKSKVLLALANLYRNNGQSGKADEMLHRIVDEFPISTISNESRRLLDLPLVETETKDISDSLYALGEIYLEKNDYNSALQIFTTIFTQYPGTKHTSKARYAAGWIYENILKQPNNAIKIYSELFDLDPNSEYSKKIQPKLYEIKLLASLNGDTSNIKPPDLYNQGNEITDIIRDTNKIKPPDLTDERNKNKTGKNDSSAFILQIGAFKNQSNFEKFFAKAIDKLGNEVYNYKSGKINKVRIGKFSNKAEALVKLDYIKSLGYADSFIDESNQNKTGKNYSSTFILQIGAFNSQSNFEEFFAEALSKLGNEVYNYKSGKSNKVRIGKYTNKDEALAKLDYVKSLGYTDSFIVTTGESN